MDIKFIMGFILCCWLIFIMVTQVFLPTIKYILDKNNGVMFRCLNGLLLVIFLPVWYYVNILDIKNQTFL